MFNSYYININSNLTFAQKRQIVKHLQRQKQQQKTAGLAGIINSSRDPLMVFIDRIITSIYQKN